MFDRLRPGFGPALCHEKVKPRFQQDSRTADSIYSADAFGLGIHFIWDHGSMPSL